MKTKIVFVLGGVLGYVLGARAGRKRYEQIKSGAQKVWNSEPVKGGVESAQAFAQDRLNRVVAVAFDAGKNFFMKTSEAPKTVGQEKDAAAEGGDAA